MEEIAKLSKAHLEQVILGNFLKNTGGVVVYIEDILKKINDVVRSYKWA